MNTFFFPNIFMYFDASGPISDKEVIAWFSFHHY